MPDKNWRNYCSEINAALNGMKATEGAGRELDSDSAFSLLFNRTISCKERGGDLYFCGNGASATMASHTVADLTKNGHLRARQLADPALLTAIGNDICFEEVFALPVQRYMAKYDILVIISSSGRSPNVLAAARAGREVGGYVVTLTGFDEDNTLRALGDLNFYIPACSYGLVESCHAALLHYWVNRAVAYVQKTDQDAGNGRSL
jgi:D-sedoheptulose 7-phosphate isomerase